MQISTFAAIEIGSYSINMEIFEISRKSGSVPLTRCGGGWSWAKILTVWERSERSWWVSSARS